MQSKARFLPRLATRVATAKELIHNLWSGPFWWLVPAVLLLLPIAVLLIFLKAAPLVAPFVYSVL